MSLELHVTIVPCAQHTTTELLQNILQGCTSGLLRQLIDQLPPYSMPAGVSRTSMKLACRYQSRYRRATDITGISFLAVLDILVTYIPRVELLNQLLAARELAATITAVKE